MNTFYEHHENSIRLGYRCFDRILLNGLIQPFQQPERVVQFFNTSRERYPVSRAVLRDIATHYQHWVRARAAEWGAPIVEPQTGKCRDPRWCFSDLVCSAAQVDANGCDKCLGPPC